MSYLHGIEVLPQADVGVRPLRTVSTAIVGLVGTATKPTDATWEYGAPVLVTASQQIADFGESGTVVEGLQAIFAQTRCAVVVVPVADDSDAASSVAGSVEDGDGVFALLGAQAGLGYTPRIVLAPHYSGSFDPNAATPTNNAVASHLLTVAEQLRAVAILDGPTGVGVTAANAIAFAELQGSDRAYVVWPQVQQSDGSTLSASPYVAGAIARRDAQQGFWWSPSNQALLGIQGVTHATTFSLQEPTTESHRLNAAGVATILRLDGFRLWGNRVTAATGTQTTPFLAVRRTLDTVYDSIEQGFRWAIDRPFSANLVSDIQESVNAYLRQLRGLGAIVDGSAWIDPEINTKTTLQDGLLTVDFDLAPATPLDRLSFRAYRNNDYYSELLSQAA